MVTLANLNSDAGDLKQTEEIVRRAMAIMERIGETESTAYAGLLNNLGEIYRQRLDYTHSEEQYLRSLAISEKVLGEDGYFRATAFQNLGIIARERKDYAAAEAYYGRALSIRQRIVGPNHPDVAQVLNNPAIIIRAKGDIEGSLQMHLRALSIWENAAGPYQQATLLSVGNIARTYAAAGDIPDAIAYQRRADEILEKQLALNVAIGSERQKLLFVNGAAERTDRTISLHLIEARTSRTPARWRRSCCCSGRGASSTRWPTRFAAVRQRVADVGDRTLLDQLKDTTAQLARLALTATDPSRVEQRLRAMKEFGSAEGESRGGAQRTQRGIPFGGGTGHARGGPVRDPRRCRAARVRDLPAVRPQSRAQRRGLRIAALRGLRRAKADAADWLRSRPVR